MGVAIAPQLAHVQPFQVEGEHAAQGLVDAELLLELDGLADGEMPHDVQHCGRSASDRLRLVEQGRGMEAGNDFILELSNAVTLARSDRPQVREIRRRLHPLPRPAMEDDVVQ